MGKNNNQEVPGSNIENILKGMPEELQGIAAEFPDFAEIIAGANYDSAEPEVVGSDTRMHYYLAAPNVDDSGKNHDHPASVDALKQKGYRVSEKKVLNPKDRCVLMEQPEELYQYRMKQESQKSRERLAAVKRQLKHGEPGKGLQPVGDSLSKPPGLKTVHGE